MRKAEWKREQRRKAREQKREALIEAKAKALGVSPRAYREALATLRLRAMVAGGLDQFGKVS
jgi:hypothetical protein